MGSRPCRCRPGPYVSLEVDDLGLTFGSATLQGSFAFSRQVAADGTAEITVAATGVTVTAGPASLTRARAPSSSRPAASSAC